MQGTRRAHGSRTGSTTCGLEPRDSLRGSRPSLRGADLADERPSSLTSRCRWRFAPWVRRYSQLHDAIGHGGLDAAVCYLGTERDLLTAAGADGDITDECPKPWTDEILRGRCGRHDWRLARGPSAQCPVRSTVRIQDIHTESGDRRARPGERGPATFYAGTRPADPILTGRRGMCVTPAVPGSHPPGAEARPEAAPAARGRTSYPSAGR